MLRSFLDPDQITLDGRFPLPLDGPFTHAEARAAGLQTRDLGVLVDQGFLRRLVAGVYVASQVEDSLELRANALRLVVPPDAVVTDRTAGWLLGAPMILAPGDHLVVPQVSMFVNRKGARLRNDLASSGQRTLAPLDVIEVLGLQVTTPLRTACDLGRLLRRDRAFAALDAMLGLRLFGPDELSTCSSCRGRNRRSRWCARDDGPTGWIWGFSSSATPWSTTGRSGTCALPSSGHVIAGGAHGCVTNGAGASTW
jgi:hypothetical protein